MDCFRYICCIKKPLHKIFKEEEEEFKAPLVVSAPIYKYDEDQIIIFMI